MVPGEVTGREGKSQQKEAADKQQGPVVSVSVCVTFLCPVETCSAALRPQHPHNSPRSHAAVLSVCFRNLFILFHMKEAVNALARYTPVSAQQ